MAEKNQKKKPSLLDVVMSVLASMFGVQSEKRRQRDFEHGEPWQYIVVGLVFVTLFVLVLVLLVRLVLSLATG